MVIKIYFFMIAVFCTNFFTQRLNSAKNTVQTSFHIAVSFALIPTLLFTRKLIATSIFLLSTFTIAHNSTAMNFLLSIFVVSTFL